MRSRVLIAGAGVAGLEAALALARLAPGLVDVELLDPGSEFVYRPLLVAEPFGAEADLRFDLDALVAHTGATLHHDGLAAVDGGRRRVKTAAGDELAYDSLLVAPGARPTDGIRGAITFGSSAGRDSFSHLLDRLGRRGSKRIAFVVPAATSWTIAAYELALLTAAERSTRALDDVEILLVTNERDPLGAFGPDASRFVAACLAKAGVELHASVAVSAYENGALRGDGGNAIACDQAIALPRLVVDEIPGLPQNPHGFLTTDVQMQVMTGVWAAGDVTAFPIKQGGLAAQQADVAARAIAMRAGSHVSLEPYRPVLRAELITPAGPEFMRAHRAGGEGESARSQEPLWWPPEKIAARYLGPLLAAESAGIAFEELIDLDPPDDPVTADAETEHAMTLLLAAADADARGGKFRQALAELALAERLNLVLPPEYVARRDRWRRQLDRGAAPSAAGGRIDPTLVGAAAAISDLERRVGRLRAHEAATGGAMRRDLSHLDAGIEQLRVLSRETGLLKDGR
jgi:sulfide:quinone oxidoreductase